MAYDSLHNILELLNTLSLTSNSLTGRQRKNLLSHGWRIKFDYVMLPLFLFKAFRKTYVRSTSPETYPRHSIFVGFRQPISKLNRYFFF